jgi:hypothetical protein
MSTKRAFTKPRTFKEIDMKMRRLLNLAVPFMRQSGEAAIATKRELIAAMGETLRTAAQAGHARVLYGLPCARCEVYYAAELAICPVCSSTERVLPKPKSLPWPASIPRSKAADVPLAENLSGLATINRELLARRVQPLSLLPTTQAIAIPALA